MRTTQHKDSSWGPGQGGGIRRALLRPLLLAYALYAGLLFLALALVALLGLLVLPGLHARRALTRATGRTALTLMGMPVRVHRHAALPDPCIVVANHCSYLDGVVLAATLPARFAFVIKREMSSVPLAGLLLARIGSQFVARGNGAGSARDALRVVRSAARGDSLAFFPEGTFRPEPGLMKFHIGAFAAAGRAGMPVVPLVIQGTRHCLAPGQLLPRPGRIDVRMLRAVHAPGHGGDAGDAAAALRDAAHAAMLKALGEEQ